MLFIIIFLLYQIFIFFQQGLLILFKNSSLKQWTFKFYEKRILFFYLYSIYGLNFYFIF